MFFFGAFPHACCESFGRKPSLHYCWDAINFNWLVVLACAADDMHPQDRTGHRALADLFIGLVRATAVDLGNRPLGAADEEVAQEPVPAPMVPGNWQRNSSTCLLQRNFEKVALLFSLVPPTFCAD